MTYLTHEQQIFVLHQMRNWVFGRHTVDEMLHYASNILTLRPGDVIAFDWHLRHTSICGRDRRQWTVSYVSDPATDEETAAFADVVIDGNLAFLLDDLDDYDHAAYPPYDAHWLSPDPAHPERVALSDRMRALGMFQVVEQT